MSGSRPSSPLLGGRRVPRYDVNLRPNLRSTRWPILAVGARGEGGGEGPLGNNAPALALWEQNFGPGPETADQQGWLRGFAVSHSYAGGLRRGVRSAGCFGRRRSGGGWGGHDFVVACASCFVSLTAEASRRRRLDRARSLQSKNLSPVKPRHIGVVLWTPRRRGPAK